MLKIRLTRTGKKGQPSYRIIVIEQRSRRDGHPVDSIGFYNPLTEPATIKINKIKYDHWLTQGAQPTPTVRSLRSKSK